MIFALATHGREAGAQASPAMRRLPSILISLGVALILLSVLWSVLVPPEMFWSDEQHEKRAAAATIYHELAYTKRGTPELQAAKERYDKWESDLQDAINTRNRTGPILRWIGVVAALAGLAVFFVVPRDG